MKIICKKERLLDQIQRTQITNIKSTLPILNNIFISAKEGYLTTIGTDMNINIKYKQKFDIYEEGEILLPGRKFIEVINSLLDDIFIETEDLKIIIKSGKSIFHILGISPSEYPQFPEIEKKITFTFNSKILLDMIKTVIFSASLDETLIPFCGIHLILKDRSIKLVTTDGHRLSVIRRNIEVEEDIDVIIPIKTVYEIQKVFRGLNCPINISISDKEMEIEGNYITIISRLLGGKFLDYNKVIPKEEDLINIELEKNEFNSVLKRVSLMVLESNNFVKFNMEDKILSISAKSSEFGEAREDIEIEEKEKFSISFNPKYIFDILKSCDYEKIIFGVTKKEDKGVIKIKDNPDIIHIIMPIKA